VAYLLFIDESGRDRRASPYEVLAGVAIEDSGLWPFIDAIKQTEERFFGLRYSREHQEVKGKRLLKRKVFRLASQMPGFAAGERRTLARECLLEGDRANRAQITALAQAKLGFVEEVFRLCDSHRCRFFASIVHQAAPRPVRDVLRKDYAFLFERFFYFLEDHGSAQGIVVFDELERSQANLLVGQMEEYFLHTRRGRERARLVVPEPFFVHSDLTSAVQVADVLAYVISWGFRVPRLLEAEVRPELVPLAEQISGLRYRTRRDVRGRADQVIWSFAVIDDLRGWEDRP
jgi:hypothetical protein